jgi:Leucine-rich repeat (LRR) protein
VLDGNRIKQIQGGTFEGMSCLRELRIVDNGIRMLRAFADLPALQTLHASNNRLVDLEDLDLLQNCTILRVLSLSGNSVTRKPGYRYAVVACLRQVQVCELPEKDMC